MRQDNFDRVQALFGNFDFRQKTGLEFGALSRPFLAGVDGVKMFNIDHLSTEELKAKYAKNPRIRNEDIIDVDFVIGGRPLSDIVGEGKRFDFSVGIHVGEHVPDFLGWLDDISSVLVEGGEIALALPDKRRCFDLARPVSTADDLLGAWLDQRKSPPPSLVFQATRETYQRNGRPVWAALLPKDQLQRVGTVEAALKRAKAARTEYVDTHCWVWTPRAFVKAFRELAEWGVLDYEITHMEIPPREHAEFFVRLRKVSDNQALLRSIEVAWCKADLDRLPG